ncbi:MAG: B12-binding domain-containing radical SAM protein [Spirochaetaceae bacterium]|nr:B12-binding domain-containing radical SAM protein [Spirochaetaceae bacterium]
MKTNMFDTFLLVNPPQKYYLNSGDFSISIPLNLLYVAAAVKEICQVEIFDCLVEYPENKKVETSYIYGTPYEKIREKIKERKPKWLGIGIPFSTQGSMAVKVAEICREVSPETKIILGGSDVSIHYDKYLKDHVCDYAFIGEAELNLPLLIRNYKTVNELLKIPGIAFIHEDNIVFNPPEYNDDLDNLPFPAYEMIDFDKYFESPYFYKNRSLTPSKSVSLITSRGCPYDCIFCSIHLHMGKKFRYHSPSYVQRHIEHLINKYGIRYFHFEDDNFTLNTKRFSEILDNLLQYTENIHWDTPNGIRADSLNEDLINKMKQTGCFEVTFAIESANDYVRNEIIGKKIAMGKIMENIRFLNQYNIPINAFYIIGFPGEKIEQMEETIKMSIDLYKTYKVSPFLFYATPLKGTKLYDISMENNHISKDLDEYHLSTGTYLNGNPLIQTEDFSTGDLKRLAFRFLLELKKIGMPASITNHLSKKGG